MKTSTTTVSNNYTCDGCSATANTAGGTPDGWKVVMARVMSAAPTSMLQKEVDLCAACSTYGNSSGTAALAKLVE